MMIAICLFASHLHKVCETKLTIEIELIWDRPADQPTLIVANDQCDNGQDKWRKKKKRHKTSIHVAVYIFLTP